MNKVIWKFPLEIDDVTVILMPKHAKVLSVGLQNTQICIWAMVNPEAEKEKITIEVYGTGNPITENMENREFLGTVIAGQFVWHVFKVLTESELNEINVRQLFRHML